MEIKYRYSNKNDIEFIAESIIEAEKNGTKTFSYNTIFGLNEKSAKNHIIEMLSKDLDGCELSKSSYILAVINNQPVASIGAWIESKNGLPSKTIKGNLLLNVMQFQLLFYCFLQSAINPSNLPYKYWCFQIIDFWLELLSAH